MPRYECDMCGACCKGSLIVEADALDVLREPRLIDADRYHRGKTVEQMVREIQEDWKAVILTGQGPCPFLSPENRCGIYPTRPNCCVGLQAGDEQCQEARAAQGLPPLQPVAETTQGCVLMHKNRTWSVMPVADAAELARKLTEMTWCCCNGFELAGYLWLNDSTSADGAQEYAVLKRAGPDGRMIQIESVTFSWCSYEQALDYIERTLRGEDDGNDFAVPISPRIQTPEEHAPATIAPDVQATPRVRKGYGAVLG